ncbi:MAG TPA: T9SS type A sorting domain-containing protein [Ignavibacteriales bacterium]|nr:T9SS type A sorting domain-containing protein [Ignavibacteriales bacterium]
MKVKLLSLLFFALFTCIYAQNDFWQKVSHVDAGNSVSIAVDSLGYVYNGTSDEGLFQSTDHGQTWKKLDLGFSNAAIKKVRVIPDGSITVLTSNYGILISKDLGKTWSQINGSLNVKDILTFSASSKYLLAGTSSGLYKSSDGGKSWTADPAFNGMKVLEIEQLNGVIFSFSRTADYVFATSTDGGNSWLKSSISYEGFEYNNASFAYIPAAEKVFCAAYTELSRSIFRASFSSINKGKTWTGGLGGNVNAWTSDATGNLYAACFVSGVTKSTDLGATWQSSGSGISNPFVQSITYDPKGYIYAGTTGGVIVSTDSARSWKSYTTGFNNTFVNGLAVDPSGNIYASTGKCFYWSKDNGLNWQSVTAGLEMLSVSNLRQVKNNTFIYSEEYYGISIVVRDSYKFNPALNKWVATNVFVDEFAIDKNGDIYTLFQSYSRGWANYFSVSTDNGNTWNNRNLGNLYLDDRGSFTIDPNGTFYFAVAFGGGVKKSYDKGATWQSTGYSDKYALKIRSNSKGYLFFMPDSKRLLLSKDEGSTWTSIVGGLPNVTISDFYLDSKDRVFILGNSGRIYYSADNGSAWTDITNNLQSQGLKYIAFGPNLTIYAATSSGEIFKTTELVDPNGTDNVKDPANSSVTKPKEYSLDQNYPNPFNPTTTIRYSIPHAGNVNISLFDALGNKVMELVNEYKSEGIFHVEFDGKGFTSGVYFYRIQSGSYAETKKLMLLK